MADKRFGAPDLKDHPTFAHEKRWVREPGHCLLCNEAYKSWGAHVIASRTNVHRILEMVYDVIVQHEERRWGAKEVLRAVCVLQKSDSPGNSLIGDLHALLDRDDRWQRYRIVEALKILRNRGVFDNTFRTNKDEGNLALVKGSNIIPVHLMRLLMVLFSEFDTGYLSGVIENIIEWQNVERTYIALGCREIFSQTERNLGLLDGDAFKAIIGDLHYATESRPGRPRLSSATRSLAQFALLGCLAELILSKMSQWTERVDVVWRAAYSGKALNHLLSRKHKLNASTESAALAFPVVAKQLTQFLAHRFHSTWASQYEKRAITEARCAVVESEFGQPLPVGDLVIHTPNSYRARFSRFFHLD